METNALETGSRGRKRREMERERAFHAKSGDVSFRQNRTGEEGEASLIDQGGDDEIGLNIRYSYQLEQNEKWHNKRTTRPYNYANKIHPARRDQNRNQIKKFKSRPKLLWGWEGGRYISG